MKILLITILPLLVLSSSNTSIEKYYNKTYYDNGQLKAEGWMLMGDKVDYWYFYTPEGTVKFKGNYEADKKDGYWFIYDSFGQVKYEGHYNNDKKISWWVIYNAEITKKTQFSNDMKNGYCLWYLNNKLFRAERFKNDVKEGEWTTILAFKRDNPNVKF